MTDDTIQKVYFADEDNQVTQYDNITQAIRLGKNRVRVELEDGRKAKKDGSIIGATGSWDVWVYYPGDGTTESHEAVNSAFEMPGEVIRVDGKTRGKQIRRIKSHA